MRRVDGRKVGKERLLEELIQSHLQEKISDISLSLNQLASIFLVMFCIFTCHEVQLHTGWLTRHESLFDYCQSVDVLSRPKENKADKRYYPFF